MTLLGPNIDFFKKFGDLNMHFESLEKWDELVMHFSHIGICTNSNIVANACPKRRNHVYTSMDDALYSHHEEKLISIVQATSLTLGNTIPHVESIVS